MTTRFACIVLLITVGIAVAAWAVCIKLGAKWAGKGATWNGCFRLAFLVFSVNACLSFVQLLSADYEDGVQVAILAVTTVASLCFPFIAIRKSFSATAKQTLMIWLPTLLGVGVSLVVALGVRFFLLESFVVPTNAMAPTILGMAVTGACPECGETTYLSALHLQYRSHGHTRTAPLEVICKNFHTTSRSWQDVPADPELTTSDRVLTNKLITPHRWDLVVFRAPPNPSQNYVKRAVGLPGETVQIKDDSVWINGTKLSPPDHLKGLMYANSLRNMPNLPLNGADPITLGDDEYFVLGDNTMNSLDSRLWTSGVPGRPPYAVPKDYIIGVVTHIYWPKDRFRSLR